MDFPKVLNVLLGLLVGLAVVVAIANYFDPPTIQSHCSNILDHGEIIGERCTFDQGSLLERVELSPEACFEKVRKHRGEQYAAYACYPDDSLSMEKRPL